MTTATQAFTVLRGILEGGMSIPLRWQNEDADSDGNVDLPDTPAAFAYIEFLVNNAELVGFGGGRGSNVYRNYSFLVAYVFVPRGWGPTVALDYAETAAGLLRSYRDTDISCFGAAVYPGGEGADLTPPGLTSEVGNYFWATMELDFWFDSVG